MPLQGEEKYNKHEEKWYSKKKDCERARQAIETQNIQLSSARNVAMNTSGGTFNAELKLAEMTLLLL